ncbi:MAG: 50S ribosomal protein L25 [Deltaproteobacteria bacterium]|nr:50S ribosomal protein L25 [Deltaproteobacteria bacterium]
MEQIELTAVMRNGVGKEKAKKLRREGLVPAILYGPVVAKALSLSLNGKDLKKALSTGAGSNVLVNIKIQDDKKKKRVVMFRGFQRDVLTREIIHADLYELVMDHKIAVDVPVHLVGKAEGVAMGGIIQQESRTLKIECLPNQIPDKIDVDVTSLIIGHSIHVKDITLPQGLKIAGDPNQTIVLVAAPTEEVAVKTAEEIQAELAKSFEEKEKPEEKPVHAGSKQGKEEEKKK